MADGRKLEQNGQTNKISREIYRNLIFEIIKNEYVKRVTNNRKVKITYSYVLYWNSGYGK